MVNDAVIELAVSEVDANNTDHSSRYKCPVIAVRRRTVDTGCDALTDNIISVIDCDNRILRQAILCYSCLYYRSTIFNVFLNCTKRPCIHFLVFDVML